VVRRARVYPCFIFDDAYSVLHAVLGAAVRVAAHMGLHVTALLTILAFIVYEVVEDRVTGGYGRAKCDVLEFIVGFLAADALLA